MDKLNKQTTLIAVATIVSQIVDSLLAIPVGSSVAVIGGLLTLLFNRQASKRP